MTLAKESLILMAGITVVVHFGARPMLATVVYLLSIFKTHPEENSPAGVHTWRGNCNPSRE